jgi:hypothetical protein
MSIYSDDDNERAMKAILKLATPDKGYIDLTIEDAKKRLKKIAEIAEGGDIPYDEVYQ